MIGVLEHVGQSHEDPAEFRSLLSPGCVAGRRQENFGPRRQKEDFDAGLGQAGREGGGVFLELPSPANLPIFH